MKSRILPLAAVLALSSCVDPNAPSRAESFAPHETNPDLVGKKVTIAMGHRYFIIGTLLPDGRLRNDWGVPLIINWDHVHRVN